MFCPKCGKQLPEGAKFCTACGTQISVPEKKKSEMKAEPPGAVQIPVIPLQSVNMHKFSPFSGVDHITQKNKELENKNKRTMLILLAVLLILLLVAAGMAGYYFLVLKNNDQREENVSAKVQEDEAEADETEKDADSDTDETIDKESGEESDSAPEEEERPAAEERSEEAKVVSDTNEVIQDIILYNIPKALYSYDFDEDLGNAQVAVRNAPETMPEITSSVEPQYVTGIDGKAVYLDGTYGIRLSDVQKIGDSYTVAFWMKADELYDWSPFIHIGYGLLDQNQRCRLWLGQKTDGTALSPILSSEHAGIGVSYEIRPSRVIRAMEPGVWYHIVFTVDGSTQGSNANSLYGSLYVAGQYAGGGNIALNTMNVDDFDVYLGINCWDTLYPVAFDSVKIWNQVLDADQVKELFQAYE